MNTRCWNCGQDFEVDEAAIRREERDRIAESIRRQAAYAAATGYALRWEVLDRLARDLVSP